MENMGKKKDSESTLYLKKTCFRRKQMMSSCREKHFPLRFEAEKYVDSEQKPIKSTIVSYTWTLGSGSCGGEVG